MLGRRQFLGWTAAAGLGAFSFPKAFALQDGQPSRTARGAALHRAAYAARVARAGEPWISYFSPRQFVDELHASGYSSAHCLGSGEMNERYFRNRADGFRLYGSGQMMSAQV